MPKSSNLALTRKILDSFTRVVLVMERRGRKVVSLIRKDIPALVADFCWVMPIIDNTPNVV